MRENCLYGSEGGGTGTTGPSYPYQESLRDMDSGFRRNDEWGQKRAFPTLSFAGMTIEG